MFKNNIDNIYQMINGHFTFLNSNTGLTTNQETQHYVLNPDHVLANNRHHIDTTRWVYQPDGDSTTEGQSLQILGALYCYHATQDPFYLDKAKQYFDGYHLAFFNSEPFPDPPRVFHCNWIANGKDPELASYPLDPKYPTHGGFKGVIFDWVDGRTKIPSGAPHWGEYLDNVWFAFDEMGTLGWNQVNATVYKLLPDGTTDWDSSLDVYYVEWIIDRLGRKVNKDGDILEEGLIDQKGTVQLQNTSINGRYRFNYATKNPVEHGGYMFSRNERWHNRPVHVPIDNYENLNFASNASDGELWWCDACKQLWDITGDRKYWLAWQCSLKTCMDYSDIDKYDKFFRQSTQASTPFTDGISYEWFYPSDQIAVFDRDEDGYIIIEQSASAQSTLEQQSIWFKVNNDSKFHCVYGGVDTSNTPLRLNVSLELNPEKEETGGIIFRCGLPQTNHDGTMHDITVPLKKFCRTTNLDGTPFITSDIRMVADYGNNTKVSLNFETNILAKYDDNIISCEMDSDGGLVVGFWLLDSKKSEVKSLTYRTFDDDFNIRITDDDGWRWWAMLPASSGAWVTQHFTLSDFRLNSYQPDHDETETRPLTPNFSECEDFTLMLDTDPVGQLGKIEWYCINDLPILYDDNNVGDYTIRCTLTFSDSSNSGYTALLGDVDIIDYMTDGLAYTRGVIPFSNITDPYSNTYSGWRGLPYPGYQYPLIYCFNGEDILYTELNNTINFLYDSQKWFTDTFNPAVPGPCAQAYIWNRQDNLKYGEADTFTMLHWFDTAWSGYEPRAFMAGARCLHELFNRGEPIPQKLVDYCQNWMNFIFHFMKSHDGNSPTYFNKNGSVEYDGFNGHMCGLWLAASSIMAICGYKNFDLIDMLVEELQRNYDVISSGHIMNGAWSAHIRDGNPTTIENNSMFFGFHSGEILRGLGLAAIAYSIKQ